MRQGSGEEPRVEDSGHRVQSLGSRIQGLVWRIQGCLGSRIQGLIRLQGLGLKLSRLVCRGWVVFCAAFRP